MQEGSKLNWVLNNIKENYKVVSVMKSDDKVKITRLRNEIFSRDIVVREFKGSGDTYRKLLTTNHINLPEIYEVFTDGDNCTVLEEFIDGVTVADVLSCGLYTERGAAAVATDFYAFYRSALYIIISNTGIHPLVGWIFVYLDKAIRVRRLAEKTIAP